METLDGTVIATALPTWRSLFPSAPSSSASAFTAYMLTLAIFLPASGWLADRFGTRTVFGGAIAAFTLTSIACGLAPNFQTFIAARIAQGAAGALMSPVGRLVVLRATEKRNLLRAAAITIWPGLLAPVIGPPLGGFISTYASWRGIFLLNVPLGIAGVLLVLRYVPEFRGGKTPALRPCRLCALRPCARYVDVRLRSDWCARVVARRDAHPQWLWFSACWPVRHLERQHIRWSSCPPARCILFRSECGREILFSHGRSARRRFCCR
jgi:MFS family permease